MLTQELSNSVERTLVTLTVLVCATVLLMHFGLSTESVTITLPMVSSVMTYWFAGSFTSSTENRNQNQNQNNQKGGQ